MKNSVYAFALLFLTCLGLFACQAAPVARATITNDFDCKVEKVGDRPSIETQLCLGTKNWVFLLYTSLDENFAEHLGLAMGSKVAGPEAVKSELRPTSIIEDKQDRFGYDRAITLKVGGQKRTLRIFPLGQPSIFGEVVELDTEIPPQAMALVPQGSHAAYSGRVRGKKFLLYGTRTAQEPPKDEIDIFVQKIWPSIPGEIHFLLESGRDLAERKVLRTYSHQGGTFLYIETEDGVFLFTRGGDAPPLFGEILQSYYVENE